MLDLFQSLLISQYEAAFETLRHCIDQCPDAQWNGPLANHTFNESAFHALFFADVYLGQNLDALKTQEFHREHASVFGDYEELESREPVNTYPKPFVSAYLEHCRQLARQVLRRETAESLRAKADFPWHKFSRGELHVYNIRHLQHHAAQLIMRLRLDTNVDIPWVKCGQ